MQQCGAAWCSVRHRDVCGTLMQRRHLAQASRWQRGSVPWCLLERLPHRRDWASEVAGSVWGQVHHMHVNRRHVLDMLDVLDMLCVQGLRLLLASVTYCCELGFATPGLRCMELHTRCKSATLAGTFGPTAAGQHENMPGSGWPAGVAGGLHGNAARAP